MTDVCVKMLLDDGTTRVTGVVLTQTVAEARRRHQASAMATVALGRGMVAATLLSSTVRETGSINLQLVANGPLGAMVVDAKGKGTVRAYLRRPTVEFPTATSQRISVAQALGRDGFINVIMDPAGGEFSRGTCALVSSEVDEDVGEYLEKSAQVHSAIGTDVLLTSDTREVMVAAGLLVQSLPGSDGRLVDQAQERLKHGGMYHVLGGQAPADVMSLAKRLFPEEHLTVLEERRIVWQCTCSRERVLAAVSMLGRQEVANILVEDGRVDARCDFCMASYQLSQSDLTALLAEMDAYALGGPEVA
ncbi:MAG: Hsp33 family molecular chaperone HslO [Myxococcota bacterium]